jgi:hypothetical protein
VTHRLADVFTPQLPLVVDAGSSLASGDEHVELVQTHTLQTAAIRTNLIAAK